MPGAFEIVMEERKALVDKIIGMMKKGYFFNQEEWNKEALRPQNPLSKVQYKGGNRMRLMAMVMEKGYADPRWATARQYAQKGYYIKKGEHGIICEKWIFEKQKRVQDENGNFVFETVELAHPQVSYFRVFNAEQVQDFPKFTQDAYPEPEMDKLIDQIINTSECPVRELAQDRSFYSPATDEIVLPLRSKFKDQTSFAKVLLHELAHSTGAASRLNRPLGGAFGSESYAKEELRAEIGSLFTETDMGIHLTGEHYEDHSDYLRSWIGVLSSDYNEFFRACADAEKISQRLVSNYTKKYELPTPVKINEIPEHEEVSVRQEEKIL